MKKINIIAVTVCSVLATNAQTKTVKKAVAKPIANVVKKTEGLRDIKKSLPNITMPGFTMLPSGLQYKIIEKGKGNYMPKIGDIVSLGISVSVSDSALFDSYKMNANQPVPVPVAKPQFNGDVMELFTHLVAGDSVVAYCPQDSVFRGGQKPAFAKAGDKITYKLRIDNIKTAEAAKAEKDAADKLALASQTMQIDSFIKAKGYKNVITTASGLRYVITTPGNGKKPESGKSEVTMNYTGQLLDGSIFDSNELPKYGHVEPFKFPLGQGRVIKGWDEGVALLSKGAKATLIIPSTLAYGPQSMPGNPNNPKGIPANSVLAFDVTLVDF